MLVISRPICGCESRTCLLAVVLPLMISRPLRPPFFLRRFPLCLFLQLRLSISKPSHGGLLCQIIGAFVVLLVVPSLPPERSLHCQIIGAFLVCLAVTSGPLESRFRCQVFGIPWLRGPWFMLCRTLKPCLDPCLVVRADAFCYHAVIPVPFHFECGMRNVRLGLAVYSLGLQRAMVDARVDVLVIERGIGGHRPALAYIQQLADRSPESDLAPVCITPFERGFGAQPCGRHLARGCEQMGVEIARIAARIIPRRMNSDVERESIALDQFPGKSRDQIDSRLRREFGRQGDQIFARGAGVATPLSALGNIP